LARAVGRVDPHAAVGVPLGGDVDVETLLAIGTRAAFNHRQAQPLLQVPLVRAEDVLPEGDQDGPAALRVEDVPHPDAVLHFLGGVNHDHVPRVTPQRLRQPQQRRLRSGGERRW
jgi:hypothetical protein